MPLKSQENSPDKIFSPVKHFSFQRNDGFELKTVINEENVDMDDVKDKNVDLFKSIRKGTLDSFFE